MKLIIYVRKRNYSISRRNHQQEAAAAAIGATAAPTCAMLVPPTHAPCAFMALFILKRHCHTDTGFEAP